MQILDFARRATPRERWLVGGLAVVAGAANALLLVLINHVAGLVGKGQRPGWLEVALFLGAFALYFQSERVAVTRSSTVIERLLKQLRLEVVDRLRRSELPVADRVGRGTLYDVVSQVTTQLSVTIPVLVESFQQGVLLLLSLLYLGYLSLPALGVFVLAVVVGGVVVQRADSDFRATLEEVNRHRSQVLEVMTAILDGGKELRLNRRRSDAVLESFRAVSAETRTLLVRSGEHAVRMMLTASLAVYGMMGVVAFIFPKYIGGHSTLVFQLVPTLLFCMTAVMRIVSQLPTFGQAAVGLDTILTLRDRLDVPGAADPAQVRRLGERFTGFRELRYEGLTYSYRDPQGAPLFTAGPLDLAVQRGEVIFVVGGNGSGKSTFMRLVTGLYPADAGRILVDGRALEPGELAGLRELFSAIFMDFHLFDALYGLEGVDPERVRALIREMRLEDAVDYRDGRFTDLRLSTGQRKRLALIAALLEDRPVYVFDEWSAEQDMPFREYFYRHVVPGLKAQGKAVLVVTHDERFWNVADRVIKLDLGAIEWDRPGPEAGRSPH